VNLQDRSGRQAVSLKTGIETLNVFRRKPVKAVFAEARG
jgi:hypothetical protein